tara:strand:- start:469 stop:792 length:324 start_codon:yes stop_codon:yes gene_type:complete
MRDTMTEFSFCDWFQKSAERKNQFSYEGLRALYEYLTDLEDDIGQEFEFDPIALCCEYTEYESLEDFQKQHCHFEDGSIIYKNIKEIEEMTRVIKIPNSDRFIIQNF